MSYYRRNLPHWQPAGAKFFITFRLAGTLPSHVVDWMKKQRKQLNEIEESKNKLKLRKQIQREIFYKYEHFLDDEKTGPKWLNQEKIAEIVCEAIHYRDANEYDLYAYCIMPNHVHLVFKLLDKKESSNSSYPVTSILQRLKSFTAVRSNKILNRSGSFWQNESFDRVIRDAEELEKTIAYTLNNPVKAELIDYWEKWPYSYCKQDFLAQFQC